MEYAVKDSCFWLSKCYLCRLRGREADVFPVHSSIDQTDFLWHKNKSGLFYISILTYISDHGGPGHGVMIYTVNCTRFGYKLIGKETLIGTQTTYDILRKLKINISFLKFLTCGEFAASVNRRHPKLNKRVRSVSCSTLLCNIKS